MPRWAFDEVTKVMAEGHDRKHSHEVTIAVLEAVATVINEMLWGGGEMRWKDTEGRWGGAGGALEGR